MSTYQETINNWPKFEKFQDIHCQTWKIVINKKKIPKLNSDYAPIFENTQFLSTHVLGMRICSKLDLLAATECKLGQSMTHKSITCTKNLIFSVHSISLLCN